VQYEELVIPSAFKIDLLVAETVVVELKSTDKIHPIHQAQILTYLKLAKLQVGLLINFNVPLIKDGIKRFHV
jgi:GxxExxY protein